MLRPGEPRVYDTNGSLQHVWPLPDVPSGGECGAPHYGACQCHWDAHLFLEDAASGLVGYILDKQVHLLRLADGANATVGREHWRASRRTDSCSSTGGGSELKPFASLPLR